MFNPIKEIDIYGVFLPPLLLWALLSIVVVKICHAGLLRLKFYRSDFEQKIFDFSLFVIVIGLLSFLVH